MVDQMNILWNMLTFLTEKETQKGKMKNTKAQKCKRCENVKSKRCENEKKIKAAFENPKKLIVIVLNMARFLHLLASLIMCAQ